MPVIDIFYANFKVTLCEKMNSKNLFNELAILPDLYNDLAHIETHYSKNIIKR
jgi:hypothetical protein